jgi:hypothetical protein
MMSIPDHEIEVPGLIDYSGESMKVCDYCSKETDRLRATPYMADVTLKAKMCEACWEWSREASGGEIGHFNDVEEAES